MSDVNLLVVDQHTIQLIDCGLCSFFGFELHEPVTLRLACTVRSYLAREYVTKARKCVV
ncbi:hypothetical protein Hanom_Chr02g00103041 [Helianthus anomalus]